MTRAVIMMCLSHPLTDIIMSSFSTPLVLIYAAKFWKHWLRNRNTMRERDFAYGKGR